ncbi:MAG: tripartite tricarboxylate transporter TctB family protein [Ramlibacter sp.]
MSEGGKTARSDLLGGAGWVGFGLLIVTEALRMDRFTAMGATLYTMPGFVPGIIGSLIVLLGVVLMLRGWRRGKTEGKLPDADTGPVVNRRVGITLVLSLVYAGALLGRAPFWLVTALFVAAFTWFFAPDDQPPARRVIAALIAGAVTSAVVTVVFQHVFLVRLP